MVTLAALLLSNIATGLVTRFCLTRMTVNAQPLIAAIESYERKEGHPPAKLDSLVPQYLSKIPQTGIAIYPQFEYTTAEKSEGWMLEAPCSLGGTMGARCFYLSSKNYEPYEHRSEVQAIGDWRYIHK